MKAILPPEPEERLKEEFFASANSGYFVDVGANADEFAAALLGKIEKIELPKKRQVVKFDFRVPPRSGDQVAVIEDLHKSYGRRVIYQGFSLTIRRGDHNLVKNNISNNFTRQLSLEAINIYTNQPLDAKKWCTYKICAKLLFLSEIILGYNWKRRKLKTAMREL